MDNEQKQREFLEAIQEVNRLASEIDKKLAEVFKKEVPFILVIPNNITQPGFVTNLKVCYQQWDVIFDSVVNVMACMDDFNLYEGPVH